jgi:protein-tyrosine phosphatase
LFAAGIQAVIELADSEAAAVLPRELIRCRFPLSDGGDNPAWIIRLAAETVAFLLQANIATLVCCASGLSRSVCVAAGGLALADRISLNEALKGAVGTGPADVAPGLFVQFQAALGESILRSVHATIAQPIQG